MKEKDAAIIKVLSDIGYADEPELTPEQEKQFSRALDPEKQFLHDVEKLFNPPVLESEWAGEDGIRDTDNPLPVIDGRMLGQVSAAADYISQAVGEQDLQKFGDVVMVPTDDIIGSEDMLDGEHLEMLVNGERQVEELPIAIKMKNKYYVMDGNHKAAAGKIRGDRKIKFLVFDIAKLREELTEDSWDDAESRRTTPNPLPVADSATLNHVFDLAEELDSKILAYYKQQGKKPNGLREIGALLKRGRREFGNVEVVPVSSIVASEDMLDGGHLDALTKNQQTTAPSGDVVLLKHQGKYYAQDGNHRIAAAAARGDNQIIVINR